MSESLFALIIWQHLRNISSFSLIQIKDDISFNAIDCDTSTLELYFQGNSLLRALNVAAFAVSGYASSEGRHCKPFNPLLGETYEADFPDKGVRFFSEKVSAL